MGECVDVVLQLPSSALPAGDHCVEIVAGVHFHH
jgi:hypothetical protein